MGCWGAEHPGVTLTRHRRYLTYPNGDPARVQLIIGMGLPLDLEDESVTVGYVIKMLYHVPQNSTDYTVHFYEGAANARSQRMLRPRSISNPSTVTGNENSREEATDEKFSGEKLRKTHNELAYSEGGKINATGEDSKVGEQRLWELMEDERLERLKNRPKTSRWDIYKVLEHMVEKNGFSGRACILRTICEAADTPFTYHNGILGELAHIILTPSSSNDALSQHSDNEYHAAERLGLESESNCEFLFPECKQSILEMFSEVGFASLFG
ncbi:uncharacterized protein LOC143914045 [Arctopsyche grandis]|uniref:uncharacterized protein LOC143914045 n=1 Tax=Arctopsyche grandis TaxID=121162 RepID=UPI00406D6CF4